MNVTLWHGPDASAIVADGVTIDYTRKIHRYESSSDYKTLVTELRTYGVPAATAVLRYLVATR